MVRKNRECGILFPIFSLPGQYGIGSLGKQAYKFVDFLNEVGASIWQMLPLNVTSYGDSPYQSPSNNGLNYYFIDLDILVEKNLLTKEDIEQAKNNINERRIDYGNLFQTRIPLLKKAFKNFDTTRTDFVEFEKEAKYHDFAFFMTLKALHNFTPWYMWDKEERIYNKEIELKVIKENKDLYLFYLWTQFEFLDQYNKLKNYAHEKNIRIMGDMPLYLARDSVEAYKYPEMFLFDEDHNPTVVAGCPPDYFNADGQLWGNPIYDWEYLKEHHYDWWNKRIEQNLELFDILRIDHFRGIAAFYTIPYGAKTARDGKWVTGPGMDLFENKTHLPIIAEDLGVMDDQVIQLLKESNYPGMKVIEFALDGNRDNSHKPSAAKYNYVCYTGTHDNDPLLSHIQKLDKDGLNRFKADAKAECDLFAVEYDDSTYEKLVQTIDKLCLASPCRLAILPMADIIPFGEEARLNTPSMLSDKNWTFRYLESDFDKKTKMFLKENIEKFGR